MPFARQRRRLRIGAHRPAVHRTVIGMGLGFAYFVSDNVGVAMGNFGSYPPFSGGMVAISSVPPDR